MKQPNLKARASCQWQPARVRQSHKIKRQPEPQAECRFPGAPAEAASAPMPIPRIYALALSRAPMLRASESDAHSSSHCARVPRPAGAGAGAGVEQQLLKCHSARLRVGSLRQGPRGPPGARGGSERGPGPASGRLGQRSQLAPSLGPSLGRQPAADNRTRQASDRRRRGAFLKPSPIVKLNPGAWRPRNRGRKADGMPFLAAGAHRAEKPGRFAGPPGGISANELRYP